MSSIAARIGVANHALYAGSKSAVEGFARSFAADGGPRRITANAIAPGGIKTDMFAQNAWHYSPGATKDTPLEVIEAGIAKLIPLGRCAVPDDIAKVVMFLCHPDSEWINGRLGRSAPLNVVADKILSRSNHHPYRWQWHRLNGFVQQSVPAIDASS
jgi:3-oxoacyl-[acyl-carrier protein] reductase